MVALVFMYMYQCCVQVRKSKENPLTVITLSGLKWQSLVPKCDSKLINSFAHSPSYHAEVEQHRASSC